MKNKIFLLLLLLAMLTQAQSVVINEIVSSNSIYEDGYGNTPDWIEIYNPIDTAVNLYLMMK